MTGVMPPVPAPMLASLLDAPLADPELVYEPKYDGIRAMAEIGPGGRPVRLWSRLGNEKTSQFPEIAAALAAWAARRAGPIVLDGEIVALDAGGKPISFQYLQGRIHVHGHVGRRSLAPEAAPGGPVAFIAFDLLREGRDDWRSRPLLERRRRLERVFSRTGSPLLRLSAIARGDGRALYEEAVRGGWEGLIAKRARSVYESGRRSPEWRKLKITHEQEFVVGGWSEPRQTRAHFGALLIGFYDGPRLVYAGHVGTGFTERELSRLMELMKPLETDVCPFEARPPGHERAHWLRPRLVAQVKFTEWTADGSLRHPVYLGLRDDKPVAEVRREETRRLHASASRRLTPAAPVSTSPLLEKLLAIEDARRDGFLELPDGGQLRVGNLHKVFWPARKLTKGDLLRYYVQAAPFVLPAVADRPLVMKRFPNGIEGAHFYQHRIADVPPGVRVETVSLPEVGLQLVGGSLITLLYMAQLAAISQDPWFSRVGSPEVADYAALDLDPAPGVRFAQVLDVARWIRDELDALGAAGVPKTSGADGLHVYVALPPGTPYEAGLLFCQIVATIVTEKHPKIATVERAVKARGRRVYVDCLQNVIGKTLATAYSARASPYAGVSTPLTWAEIDAGVEREAFTIETVPARLAEVGDLWARLRESKGVNLSRVAAALRPPARPRPR